MSNAPGGRDSTFVMMKVTDNELIKKLDKFSKTNIADKDLDDRESARETEYHVSVGIKLETVRLKDVLDKIDKFLEKPITVKLGKVSRFEKEGYDVIKLEIDDYKPLQQIFNRLDKLPNENDYKDFTPHLTLAYVIKGACPGIDGDDSFEGVDCVLDELEFSPPTGLDKVFISLSPEIEMEDLVG